MKLSNKAYDILKWIATIVLPACMTLITALAAAWGWNIPIEAIDATIAAVIAFIGALLGFSTAQYRKEQNETDY